MLRIALLTSFLLACPLEVRAEASAPGQPAEASARPAAPAVIRAHFSDAEIRDFHEFRRPRWMRALLDQAAQLVLFAILFLGHLDKRLHRACERAAARVRV